MSNNGAPREGHVNDRVAERAPEVQTRGDFNLVDQSRASGNAQRQDVGQQRTMADQYMQSHNFASASDMLGPNGSFAGAGTERQAGLNPQDYGGRTLNPGDQQKRPGDQQGPPGDKADQPKEKSPYDPGTPEEIRDRMPAVKAATDGQGGWTPEAKKEWGKEMDNAIAAPGSDQGTVVSRMGKIADAFGKNPDGSEKVSVASHMDSSQEDTRVSVMLNHSQRDANQNTLSDATDGRRAPAQKDSIVDWNIHGRQTPKG